MTIKNGQITDTALVIHDRVFICELLISGPDEAVTFRGMPIGYIKYNNEYEGYADGAECMMQLMNTVGVDRWENLKGTFVRYETVSDGHLSHINTIGHIVQDKWFNVSYFASQQIIKKQGMALE